MATPNSRDYILSTDQIDPSTPVPSGTTVYNYSMTQDQRDAIQSNSYFRAHYMGVPYELRSEYANRINEDIRYVSPPTYRQVKGTKTINDLKLISYLGVTYFTAVQDNVCSYVLREHSFGIDGISFFEEYNFGKWINPINLPMDNKISFWITKMIMDGLFLLDADYSWIRCISTTEDDDYYYYKRVDELEETDYIYSFNYYTTSERWCHTNIKSLDDIYNNYISIKDILIDYAIESNFIINKIINWLLWTDENITYNLPAKTKTYTNSTWSSSKKWYIKTTFSKNTSKSNVVNYVPMLREYIYSSKSLYNSQYHWVLISLTL